MEFDFKKDYFSGKSTVKMSMGHEAFGTWLEQEGQSKLWVEHLLTVVKQLQLREINEYKLPGSEFALYLTIEEAKIINHSLHDPEMSLDEQSELNFYDQEIQAECGLEDFQNLMNSWLTFI